MKLKIPDFCLVVLIGASGSGKSTFARTHFKATEIVSSDWARGIVDDDENSMEATDDAFDVVRFLAAKRLKRRRLAVIDATNVRQEDRAGLVALAREHHALAVAIVVNPGEAVCHERNKLRPDRQFGPHVVRNHMRALRRNINRLDKEGFRYVYELSSVAEIEAAAIERQPLWTDARGVTGPFDIIGDIHGCAGELEELMARLGYAIDWTDGEAGRRAAITPPPGRRILFLGDIVDRGPRTPDALRIVMGAVEAGIGHCVLGNHDEKFLRFLKGRNVKHTHGLDLTVEQMAAEPAEFRAGVKAFVDGLVSHLWLDGGRLAVAHAGIKADMIGRSSGAVRQFCLYGETTGETDEFGLPVRHNWAADYRGQVTVVYGHTPTPEAEWLNNTICIDTGACFGGKLTALRWPEKEIVSVPAREIYTVPVRPFGETNGATRLSAQQSHDEVLEVDRLLSKLIVRTSIGRTIQVPEAQAAAALEVMTRFAANPKWLVYLPPTMSPSETSAREGLLEHPDEAFAYYRSEGVTEVVVEEKHMGSRAVLVVCRDGETARRRFGVATGETGAVLTRTGRAFFPDRGTTEAILERVRKGLAASDLWGRLATDWAVIDAEIMPWSAKAQGLIREQYAATAAAARAGLGMASRLIDQAKAGGLDVAGLDDRFRRRAERAQMYAAAYRRYCWPVQSLDDYRVAPFHLLATEGGVHMDKDHVWHMEELSRLAACADPVLMATPWRLVDLADAGAVGEATRWWEARTAAGGEGMVVKPRQYIVRGGRGLVQPAIKCRGPEYLRIIYGPEYDEPENLVRLKRRGLGHKRSMAVRELVLGQEALSRFVARAPLMDVHTCVFAILALESEPVDPRL